MDRVRDCPEVSPKKKVWLAESEVVLPTHAQAAIWPQAQRQLCWFHVMQ